VCMVPSHNPSLLSLGLTSKLRVTEEVSGDYRAHMSSPVRSLWV